MGVTTNHRFLSHRSPFVSRVLIALMHLRAFVNVSDGYMVYTDKDSFYGALKAFVNDGNHAVFKGDLKYSGEAILVSDTSESDCMPWRICVLLVPAFRINPIWSVNVVKLVQFDRYSFFIHVSLTDMLFVFDIWDIVFHLLSVHFVHCRLAVVHGPVAHRECRRPS